MSTVLNSPMAYDPDIIRQRLQSNPVVSDVYVFQSVTSTNEVAKRLAESGAPSGSLVLADRQTAGKGRRGRRWESPPGVGLWFSLLLRPQHPEDNWHLVPMLLSEMVAVSLGRIVGVRFQVKWPNDVFHGGKKICGILCESGSGERAFEYIVAGIGINVNQDISDFPAELRPHATSLRLVSGRPVDRLVLLEEVLRHFAAHLLPIVEGKKAVRLDAWKTLCPDLGKKVRVVLGSGHIEGIFREVTAAGEILIEDAARRIHRFTCGQASLRIP